MMAQMARDRNFFIGLPSLRAVARDSGLRAVVRDSPFHEYLPFLTVFGHSAEPDAVNEQVKRGDSEGKFPPGLNVRMSICALVPLWTLALPGTCSQKFKNFPLPTPSEKSKNFYGPPHALSTPCYPFPRLHTPSTRPAGTGLDGPHGGPGGSWLRHNGPEGRDGGSRGLTGGSGGVEGCRGCGKGFPM